MATPGTLPLSPDLDAWSEKDFAPIMAFLRHQIGITLEAAPDGVVAGEAAIATPGQGVQQLHPVPGAGAAGRARGGGRSC